MAAGAIIRALGWLVRHSHDEEHDKDGDILREMVVNARDELDAFGAATVNHRHEVGMLLAEIERLKAEVARLESLLDDADQVTQDALGHLRAAKDGEIDRLRRALAAGPARLRKQAGRCRGSQRAECLSVAAEEVEHAQAEAMKEDGDGK